MKDSVFFRILYEKIGLEPLKCLTLSAPGRGPCSLRPPVNNTGPRILRGCIPRIKSFEMAQTRCF